MFEPINPSPYSSPFGLTGHGTFGNPTTHSTDHLGRDVYRLSCLTGHDLTEVRDHMGNVLDRRSSPFDW